MHSHFFAYLNRMKYIRRWGLMRATQPENDMEHALQVALLAHGMALMARRNFGRDVDPEHVLALAVYHDAPEVMTGDLPTPVKYFDADIRQSYNRVEAEAARRLLATLPGDRAQALAPSFFEADPLVARIVKAADKLSALVKCVEELKMGNDDFARAKQAQLEALHAMEMPSVERFLQEFLPAYELTLDELNPPRL